MKRSDLLEPRPAVARFVRALVLFESARSGGAGDVGVAQRTTTRLYRQLEKLIGAAGFDVLLARSLLLARRAHPSLAGVTAGTGGALAGLDDTGRDRDAIQEDAIAIVSHFMELLVRLVGEDLALRLIHDLWPSDEKESKQ